ncbi:MULTISPECIES: nitroreductase family protein [unclassified Knoellia]|uniref:nitroreductase family protein n=1 Tax=Knoellia altitudinis TaxID=3404795 RepID=UPI00361D760A
MRPSWHGTMGAMDLTEAVSRRRMVRRFDADRAVPFETVERLVALAQRAPSAGHTQGWDVLALTSAQDRERFWEVSREETATEPGQSSPWLRGVSAAPVLLVMLADPTAYLDRYAEPDKGWTDRSPDRWPIPYWDTDTAMAAMVILLGAVDAGLGALFFGVPAGRHDAVRAAYAVPPGRRVVGVIALGHEARRVRSLSLRRGRRPLGDVLHHGTFGASAAGTSEP